MTNNMRGLMLNSVMMRGVVTYGYQNVGLVLSSQEFFISA